MNILIKLLLVLAAIPVALVASVHLALRLLRFVRKHRGEVAAGLVGEDLRTRFADALESWVTEPASIDGMSDHSDGEHHVHTGDHSGHSH